jgi:hypothetical protein
MDVYTFSEVVCFLRRMQDCKYIQVDSLPLACLHGLAFQNISY